MNVELSTQQVYAKNYQTQTMLADKCVQHGMPVKPKGTQTRWNRKLNKIVQYQFNDASLKFMFDSNHNNETKTIINETDEKTTTEKQDPMEREISMLSRRTSIINLPNATKTNDFKSSRLDGSGFQAQDSQDEEEYYEKLLNFLDNVVDKLSLKSNNHIYNAINSFHVVFIKKQ